MAAETVYKRSRLKAQGSGGPRSTGFLPRGGGAERLNPPRNPTPANPHVRRERVKRQHAAHDLMLRMGWRRFRCHTMMSGRERDAVMAAQGRLDL